MKINSANINYSLIFGCICHYTDQLQIIKTTKRTISHHSPSMNDICLQDKKGSLFPDPFEKPFKLIKKKKLPE